MNLQAFTKLLSRHLYPLLRKEGFRGSGANLRRIDGPLVHVFNVQGSTGSERCYLNLGAHLACLETGVWQPEKVLEYECAFQTRLDPPPGQDYGWHYGHSESEAEANALAVVAAWESQGRSFFAQYAIYPDDFARLLAELDPEKVHPGTCLKDGPPGSHLGDPARAAGIAASGLARTGEQATSLIASLKQFLAGTSG